MFNKTPSTSAKRSAAEPAIEPALARRAGVKPPSILSADIVYEGRISGDGELHVDGVVRGDIEVVCLVVGEGAVVEGTVKAETVEIRGRLLGDIEAQSVKLYATGRVEGDIAHEQLSIEVGASYQGRCRPLAPKPVERSNVIELDKG